MPDKIYYAAHKDEINRRHREYRAEHREEVRFRERKYEAANKDKIKARMKIYNDAHKKEFSDWTKKDRAEHPEKYRLYYTEHRDEILARGRRYRTMHRAKLLLYQKEWRMQLRAQFFDVYGHKCSCPCGCGESIDGFLSLGHLQNDGKEDRATNGGQNGIIRKAIEHPDHAKYATLCYNCNFGAASNGGHCPRIEFREGSLRQ